LVCADRALAGDCSACLSVGRALWDAGGTSLDACNARSDVRDTSFDGDRRSGSLAAGRFSWTSRSSGGMSHTTETPMTSTQAVATPPIKEFLDASVLKKFQEPPRAVGLGLLG
jgi:hypothetical protein